VVPFHRSAWSPEGPEPVASQALCDAHDTELSEVKPAPVAEDDQDVPFHVSTCPSPPAAMQNAADVHDTEVRGPPGTGRSAHLVPFHTSASPVVPDLPPTATQKRADTHDTPVRLIDWPARAAVFWISHLDPFHASASGRELTPELSVCEPTASQNPEAAGTHETEVRALAAAPGAAAACCSDHELPFHASARVTWGVWDAFAEKSPPASHAVALRQETPARLAKAAPAGFGGVCDDQELPFQVVPKPKVAPELVLYEPTAAQKAAVTQDIALRRKDTDPAGAGTGCAVQDDPLHSSLPPKLAASQKDADTHDTEATPCPGERWRCHEVPFHCMAIGPAKLLPVASQKLGDTHDTPLGVTIVASAGTGTCCSFQDVPSHFAAKASLRPMLSP
jgi:hypothetical protein